MKNLIKVSAVSLVAITLIFGSVSSTMAGSYQSYKSGYSSSKNYSAPKSNLKQFSRQTKRPGTGVELPNGGQRKVGVQHLEPATVTAVIAVAGATAVAWGKIKKWATDSDGKNGKTPDVSDKGTKGRTCSLYSYKCNPE